MGITVSDFVMLQKKLRDKNVAQIHDKKTNYHHPELHAVNPKPTKRVPLDDVNKRKETGWYGAARRFEITFKIYAVRPCDWDGWDVKRLQDWLVKSGILPGDGWDVLSGRVTSEKVCSEAEEKTVIEIKAC